MKNFILSYAVVLITTTSILGYSTQPITIIHQPCDRGPGAVIRSVTQGLTSLGISFNVNPTELTDLAPTVVILSDLDNVKKAIEWKQTGYIKHILAGPNLTFRASAHDHLLASSEIDVVLVASDWVRINFIEDDARLDNKIKVWYAGVNENYWQPPTKKRFIKNVLIYAKYADAHLITQIQKLLKHYGWHPVLLNYGYYSQQQYFSVLADCRFAIFLSRSESQGISLAEAWSMNVPTLVWNPQDYVDYGKRFKPVSSCPYLTHDTGLEWKSLSDLENHLKTLKKRLPSFTPRAWILEHMTDVRSALLLLDIIEKITSTNA